jgi:hypothetical protein
MDSVAPGLFQEWSVLADAVQHCDRKLEGEGIRKLPQVFLSEK